MQFLTLTEKINELGRQRIPFFLLVDFSVEKPVLFLKEELDTQDIDIDFPSFRNQPVHFSGKKTDLKKEAVSFESYRKKFDLVQTHLHHGNSFLTNLTCETSITSSLTLKEIFSTAKAKYKIRFKDEWICFSPETFIKTEGTAIHSFPMKGTIDADLPDAANQLLEDKKELAEHYTIVDLIRNDLSMIATNIRVNRFRYLEKIETSDKNLLQASSHITGDLAEDFRDHLGTLLFALLPAGSISGAPKKKTMEIIHEAEEYDRGFYTGTAFYFDGKDIDSCVLIRFIEKKKTTDNNFQLVYKSGGGITIHSEAEKEYQELINKIYVPCF